MGASRDTGAAAVTVPRGRGARIGAFPRTVYAKAVINNETSAHALAYSMKRSCPAPDFFPLLLFSFSVMISKNLLLLHDDPFLTCYYSERFEDAGFQVWAAPNLETALERMEAEPNIVLLDPLIRGEDGRTAVEIIRAHLAGGQIPILVLPTPHHSLTEPLQTMSGVTLLTALTNPLGAALKTALDLVNPGQHDAGRMMLLTAPDEQWKARAMHAAQTSLVQMRQAHHELMRAGADHVHLQPFLLATHHFAGHTMLLNSAALLHFANAVESLAFSLNRFPERTDPAAIRTLGQANDFLAILLKDNAYARMPDFESAGVMVIEDEPPARDLIIAAMDLVGLHATGAGNPDDGLALLAAQACDLIFLDINLPEMNGFEVCNRIRTLPLHERTPVVFLTGMSSFNNRVQSSLSGGNDFIGKPFNVAELGVKALIWVMKSRLGEN